MGKTRIWPKVLRHLAMSSEPLTCFQLATRVGERARSVYASMSTLGKCGGRHYIEPVGPYWRRTSAFRITPKGKQVI